MSLNTCKETVYKISRIIPWSYGGTLRRKLKEGTVLGLGCGAGWAWRCFFDKHRRSRFFSCGIDLSSECIKYCINHKVYSQALCQDINKTEFTQKSYDIVSYLSKITFNG